ncbi:MAG: hypothetical protein E3J29_06525 [Dehalococcoidia bacterium]|nr:MAG: hypothetical protein E3J29_06525 [Dehalococcoidia bacterium]
MFAGDRTEEREVPHEPDNYFTFRNLSGPELDEADVAGTRRAAEQFKMLPERVISDMMSRQADEARERDEFRGYDKATLVRYGVQSWRGPKLDGRQCSDEEKAKLEADIEDWAARVVFEMNVRPEGEGRGSDGRSSTVGASPTS